MAKAKQVVISHICPRTGKPCELTLTRVTDEPGIPAQAHWEVETVKATGDGLFNDEPPEADE